VVVQNPDHVLRGGLFAQGSLLLERIEDALPVPATAVRAEGGQSYVYEVEDEVVRRQAVELGIASRNGFVNVVKGLQPGEVIVRANLGQLREGAQARIAQVTAQAYP
jgi:multidrug efflux pump subunit AcrA (membrane-fusion protein)